MVDGKLQRPQLAVAVQPVDPQHRQARRAAEPPRQLGGGRLGGGVLQRAVDRVVADLLDQADHRDPAAGPRLGQLGQLGEGPEPAA